MYSTFFHIFPSKEDASGHENIRGRKKVWFYGRTSPFHLKPCVHRTADARAIDLMNSQSSLIIAWPVGRRRTLRNTRVGEKTSSPSVGVSPREPLFHRPRDDRYTVGLECVADVSQLVGSSTAQVRPASCLPPQPRPRSDSTVSLLKHDHPSESLSWAVPFQLDRPRLKRITAEVAFDSGKPRFGSSSSSIRCQRCSTSSTCRYQRLLYRGAWLVVPVVFTALLCFVRQRGIQTEAACSSDSRNGRTARIAISTTIMKNCTVPITNSVPKPANFERSSQRRGVRDKIMDPVIQETG